MKRRAPLAHLRLNGCELLREGAKHSWWHNPTNGRRSTIPRHTEIDDLLARRICRDLGVAKLGPIAERNGFIIMGPPGDPPGR